jgi:ornithine cyclodeaminase
MPTISILKESELRNAVPLDAAAVACVESCFRALATEPVVMPPILRLDIPAYNGEVDVKTAYVPGVDSLASPSRSAPVSSTIPSSACRASTD